MSNNIWDLSSQLRTNHRLRPQTRRIIFRTPLTSYRLLYCRLVMGDSPCMFPILRGGIGSRHLNRHSTYGSQLQASRRLQEATAFAISRFLRMSQRPATMSARLRGSCPAPRPGQNRVATAQPLNNTVVERARQEPIPTQESVTGESAGTQPPIENDESAAEELDLTLKL